MPGTAATATPARASGPAGRSAELRVSLGAGAWRRGAPQSIGLTGGADAAVSPRTLLVRAPGPFFPGARSAGSVSADRMDVAQAPHADRRLSGYTSDPEREVPCPPGVARSVPSGPLGVPGENAKTRGGEKGETLGGRENCQTTVREAGEAGGGSTGVAWAEAIAERRGIAVLTMGSTSVYNSPTKSAITRRKVVHSVLAVLLLRQ